MIEDQSRRDARAQLTRDGFWLNLRTLGYDISMDSQVFEQAFDMNKNSDLYTIYDGEFSREYLWNPVAKALLAPFAVIRSDV